MREGHFRKESLSNCIDTSLEEASTIGGDVDCPKDCERKERNDNEDSLRTRDANVNEFSGKDKEVK